MTKALDEMSDKAKDLYSGIKKILKSPSLGSSSAGRRSSSGSFSLSGALASFSLSSSHATAGNNTNNNYSDSTSGGRTSSLSAKGYADADLVAAAEAAADEMFHNESKNRSAKKERRSSFSFASWKEKHRAKKTAQQAQKEMEQASVAYGATAATPRATTTPSSRGYEYGRSNSMSHCSPANQQPPQLQRSQSGRPAERPPPPQRSLSGRDLESNWSSKPIAAPATTAPTVVLSQTRTRSSTTTSSSSSTSTGSNTDTNQLRRDGSSVRSRAASSAAVPQPPQPQSRPGSSTTSHSYSFSKRQQEKTRTTDRASTMIVDDVATIVKPRNTRSTASAWGDSDTDEDGDAYEDSRALPRTRGFSRRSVSMDFMEPQQATHLISKIWRKLPIQARLYGRGSIDLDLEKDRTSITRASATKQSLLSKLGSNGNSPTRNNNQSDEYCIVSSPLPDESNVFGDKHIRFSHKIAYSPPQGVYVGLESYDDVLVRVCQFASHDQRRTAVKVAEFLERSLAFVRGTATKRGQKVSISNEEIRMWRRLARHDWSEEETTVMDGVAPPSPNGNTDGTGSGKNATTGRSHSSSSITEEESDDDDVVVSMEMERVATLCEVINYCLSAGDSLFTSNDIEELVTLELLVEEDGWI